MTFKQIIRNFGLPFLLIFGLSLIALNWNNIGWLFNFRALKRVSQDIIEQSSPAEDKPLYQYVENEDQVDIPVLNLQAPIIVLETKDSNLLHQALDRGVVLYPGSALPGEKGIMVLLGHSAPSGWPDINYDRVFSEIIKLEKEDKININFHHYRYPYRVIDKHIFSLAQEEEFFAQNTSRNLLVLSTCYPPGKDLQRFIIVAELER